MDKKRVILLIAIVAMTLVVLSYSAPTTEQELTPVRVQLKWVHQSQFAGNYVAEQEGFYAENGIKIEEFMPFQFENWPIDMVESKNAEFGITGADELVIAKLKGEGEHVRVVAVIYKINPVVLYSLAESGITKPQDFVGKTVGLERSTEGKDINVGILYKAMMARLGIDRSKVNEVNIGYDATELLAGETDVSSGYVINEPYGVIEKGKEVNIILPADYGVNMYADVIIAHDDMIRENPELVKNFVKATLKGWQYAIEHEDEAVDDVLVYATDRTKEHEGYMLEKSIPLIHTGESPIGWMDEDDWDEAQKILFDQGIISEIIDTDQLFTNEIVEKIYNDEAKTT